MTGVEAGIAWVVWETEGVDSRDAGVLRDLGGILEGIGCFGEGKFGVGWWWSR